MGISVLVLLMLLHTGKAQPFDFMGLMKQSKSKTTVQQPQSPIPKWIRLVMITHSTTHSHQLSTSHAVSIPELEDKDKMEQLLMAKLGKGKGKGHSVSIPQHPTLACHRHILHETQSQPAMLCQPSMSWAI